MVVRQQHEQMVLLPPSTNLGQVYVLYVSVILFIGGLGLCPRRGLRPGGSLSRGVSVPGGLCPGGLCPSGLCPGGGGHLCPGGLCLRG